MFRSSSAGNDVAVVNHIPGIWGDSGPGNTEIELGIGIWNDGEDWWLRLTWAMRETEILL